MAQKKKFTNEIGFDLHTVSKLFSNKNERNKIELIYKIVSQKNDWRIKVYKEKGEYRDYDVFLRYVPVTEFCIDGKGYQTNYSYSSSLGMTLGYARKWLIKKVEIYGGLDGKVQLNRGRVAVYKEFCEIRNGVHSSSFGYIEGDRNNDKTIGFIPFTGLKIPFKRRIIFSFEIGLPLNYRFGERIFFNENRRFSSFDFNYSYTDRQYINDISISFLF